MSVTSVAPVAFRIEAGRGECEGGHRRFRNTPLRLQDYDRHDSIIWSVGWPRLPYLGLLTWNDASSHWTQRLRFPRRCRRPGDTDARNRIATSSEQTRITLVFLKGPAFLGATGHARTLLVVQLTCMRDCCFCSMRFGPTTVRQPRSESNPQRSPRSSCCYA